MKLDKKIYVTFTLGYLSTFKVRTYEKVCVRNRKALDTWSFKKQG